jgi:putative glycosyltransferase (TIGR04372 family)
MGAAPSSPLPDLHPRVIDYAYRHRNEFMDYYLAARCKAMVSTGSGLDSVSYYLRRPFVWVNGTSWGHAFINMAQPHRAIFKRFERNGRAMTLAEILEIGAQNFTLTEEFHAAGITLVENTPDEITGAVIELLDLLQDRWAPDPDGAALRERARVHFKTLPLFADWQPELSEHFLKKYRALI